MKVSRRVSEGRIFLFLTLCVYPHYLFFFQIHPAEYVCKPCCNILVLSDNSRLTKRKKTFLLFSKHWKKYKIIFNISDSYRMWIKPWKVRMSGLDAYKTTKNIHFQRERTIQFPHKLQHSKGKCFEISNTLHEKQRRSSAGEREYFFRIVPAMVGLRERWTYFTHRYKQLCVKCWSS